MPTSATKICALTRDIKGISDLMLAKAERRRDMFWVLAKQRLPHLLI